MPGGHPELIKLDQAQRIDLYLQKAATSPDNSELTRALLAKAQVSSKFRNFYQPKKPII